MSETTFLFTPIAEQFVEDSSLAAAFPAVYLAADRTLSRFHYPEFENPFE